MNSESANNIRPMVYQFNIGDFKISMLLEGYLLRNDLHPFVAANAEPIDVETLAKRHQLPYPKLEHSFTSTLLQHQDKLIAIDPGFGENAPMPTAGYFHDSLSQAGYCESDVDLVVISHCHPDHIGNLMTGGNPKFPNAEIVFGKTEYDYWNRADNIPDKRKSTLALFQKVAVPLADRIRLVEPEETIVSGLTAIDAFGHSAGHLAFRVQDGTQQLLILSDTVAHCVASFAHPEWHFSMDGDPLAAAVTRRRLLNMAATENLPMVGFHMPFPAVGYVEKSGNGFIYKPALYQLNV